MRRTRHVRPSQRLRRQALPRQAHGAARHDARRPATSWAWRDRVAVRGCAGVYGVEDVWLAMSRKQETRVKLARTGWQDGLLQDDDRKLFAWFAGRVDARQSLRRVCAEIERGRVSPNTQTRAGGEN